MHKWDVCRMCIIDFSKDGGVNDTHLKIMVQHEPCRCYMNGIVVIHNEQVVQVFCNYTLSFYTYEVHYTR
jgi:hypothetical protein